MVAANGRWRNSKRKYSTRQSFGISFKQFNFCKKNIVETVFIGNKEYYVLIVIWLLVALALVKDFCLWKYPGMQVLARQFELNKIWPFLWFNIHSNQKICSVNFRISVCYPLFWIFFWLAWFEGYLDFIFLQSWFLLVLEHLCKNKPKHSKMGTQNSVLMFPIFKFAFEVWKEEGFCHYEWWRNVLILFNA